MLSVIAAQNRNSPAQVVQKCARRLIDGTQCFHCDRLENVNIIIIINVNIIKVTLSCRNITGALYSKLQNIKMQTVAGLVTKGRLEQNSLQAAAERHQRWCISDGRRKAVHVSQPWF